MAGKNERLERKLQKIQAKQEKIFKKMEAGSVSKNHQERDDKEQMLWLRDTVVREPEFLGAKNEFIQEDAHARKVAKRSQKMLKKQMKREDYARFQLNQEEQEYVVDSKAEPFTERVSPREVKAEVKRLKKEEKAQFKAEQKQKKYDPEYKREEYLAPKQEIKREEVEFSSEVKMQPKEVKREREQEPKTIFIGGAVRDTKLEQENKQLKKENEQLKSKNAKLPRDKEAKADRGFFYGEELSGRLKRENIEKDRKIAELQAENVKKAEKSKEEEIEEYCRQEKIGKVLRQKTYIKYDMDRWQSRADDWQKISQRAYARAVNQQFFVHTAFNGQVLPVYSDKWMRVSLGAMAISMGYQKDLETEREKMQEMEKELQRLMQR